MKHAFVLYCWIVNVYISSGENYILDTAPPLGRRFDGVGAISGGGATSKLLINYPLEQRNKILDFLFKPNFGAALQTLKVEIGGDAQSSEGTESSHMHESWDENYQRGYEWWLMKEAKKRNPDIQLCGLAWGFPGWLGSGSWNPYSLPNRTADYITRWIWGAKTHHSLDIDCVGIWNEKPYDVQYIKILRHTLNERGFRHVKIIAADLLPSGSWSIVDDIMRDPELFKAVDIIGGHYTGSYSTAAAQNCSKPLWSSEDWSDTSGEDGAGCMARLLNQNYIRGYMTSLIAWNLIDSYYDYLQYADASLMIANQPWSGYYEVSPPIWAVAHTTQFVNVGWSYLQHGYGVGQLAHGGSLVSLISPDGNELTVIIETMDTTGGHFCLRPPTPMTKVVPQNVTLLLQGHLAHIKSLTLWLSTLHGNSSTFLFKNMGTLKVENSKVSLSLDVNSIYSLTTLAVGNKGSPGKIPSPASFPLPYKDTFDDYEEFQEAQNFAQQVGAFEIRQTNDPRHGKVMRQVVLTAPIHWCPIIQTQPLGAIGNYNWSDLRLSADIFVPSVNSSRGVFVAARVDQASCMTFLARGIFVFLLFPSEQIIISTDLARTIPVYKASVSLSYNRWYTLSLTLKASEVMVTLDNSQLFKGNIKPYQLNGFVALGTDSFGMADFDNLEISPS